MTASHSPIETAHVADDLHGRIKDTALIMIVDDEPINCKVTRKYLSQAGYQHFITLTEPGEAMELIGREKPDVLLLDIMMPEISGLEILRMVRENPELTHMPVLILTATTDDQTRYRALEFGATDFLTKPVSPGELLPRVRNALILKSHHDRLAGYAGELERRVRDRTSQLTMTQLEVVYCLGRAAEYRDDDTGNHVIRVGRYVGVIARQLGLDDQQIELLEHAAPLHDVGKIAIPDEVLLKPGKLTPDEYDLIRNHASLGKHVLQPLSKEQTSVWHAHAEMGAKIIGETSFPLLQMASRIALTHHEWWDGTGYPLGLAGEDIPIEGRITAVADVFDALSSKRPYKPPFPREKCFQIIEDGRGSQFDPAVVDAFFATAEQIIETQIAFAD